MNSRKCDMTHVTEDILYTTEVEDIMCDQTIIRAELSEEKSCSIIVSATKIKVAVTFAAKAIFPLVIKAYYSYLRNQQLILDGLRQQLFPTLAAFIFNSISRSLASVQKITYPLYFRVPIRYRETPALEYPEDSTPEKSVDCRILCQPDGEILADVIFIHGLHGGLDRTWKQGLWRHNRHKLKDQAPIRRQSTGNLHVPPRKVSLKRAISDIYSRKPSKMARKGSEPSGSCVSVEEDFDEVIENSTQLSDGEYYSTCWPQDWLPQDCPGIRVIALNYTTDVLWCPIWVKKRNRTGLIERSQEMIEELLKLGVGQQPIIWVGHSKGGLFIKQILLNAWENNQNRIEVINLYKQSKGIMFYSVPHRGSYLADVTVPLLRRSIELLEIQRNCQFVLDLHYRFVKMCEHVKMEIFSFIETSFTFMSFMYLKIVAYDSADAGVGVKCDVPLDHREICKPAGRDCFLYLELVKLIKKCLNQCSQCELNS